MSVYHFVLVIVLVYLTFSESELRSSKTDIVQTSDFPFQFPSFSKKVSDEHGAFARRIGVQRALKVTIEGVASMQVRVQVLVRSHNRSSFCFQLLCCLQQSSKPRGASLGNSKTLFFWPQNLHFCSFLEHQ